MLEQSLFLYYDFFFRFIFLPKQSGETGTHLPNVLANLSLPKKKKPTQK